MKENLKMKIRNLCLLVFWISMFASASCARRGMPTGGPKDTIPPQLINMSPALESVNFDEDELVLEFDEYIQARSLKQDLIINPPVKEYDFYVNSRTLVIELNEELQENTTYTFNFREAIKDVSEQNPAENAVMAFSTGSKIDSFQVQGQVRDLMTNKPSDDVLVALYPEGDTLNPFEDPPTYLTKTDEEGNYAIKYIRVGTYKLFAFNDQNNNLKIDSNNESLGFEADPLVLLPEETVPINPADTTTGAVQAQAIQDSTIAQQKTLYGKTVDVNLFRQDVRPIEIQSSRSNGKYYEVKVNKSLKDYTLIVDQEDLQAETQQYLDSLNAELPRDTTRYLYSNFQDQQKMIRVYNTIRQDSLRTFVILTDSVGHEERDTLYVQFAESRREAESLRQTVSAPGDIRNMVELNIKFSKPIIRVNTDSILLSYDTLFYLPLDYDSLLQWNDRLDELSITTQINRNQLLDTLLVKLKESDSLQFISTQRTKYLYLDSLKNTNELEQQLNYFEQLGRLVRSPAFRMLADSLNALSDEDIKSRLITSFVDTINVEAIYVPQIFSREEVMANLKPLVFYLAEGSFMSVENDSSQQILQQYSFKKPEEYGTIAGDINTTYESYTIQLLDKSNNLIADTQANNGQFTFELVPPGQYTIRILVDEDQDGKWEEGNILENREPEPVFFYTAEETIDLRANWVREISLTF
jgi:uncharacterized protein (DUF2141 family)